MQQTFVHVRTAYCSWFGWKNSTWWFLRRRQVIPWPQWMKWVSSRILLSHLGLRSRKKPFLYLVVGIWQLRALHSFIYVDVGEPTSHPCSITGMMQDHHLPYYDFELLGVTWNIYLRELLCHREEVLSGLRIFVLFWKRSVSPSSPGVFLWCFGFVFGWVCLFLFGRHLAFSPILQDVGIANQRQNVLMTVRASSVHGSKHNSIGDQKKIRERRFKNGRFPT